MVRGSGYRQEVFSLFCIFSITDFLNCPVTTSLERRSRTRCTLNELNPVSHRVRVVEAMRTQVDTLNSLAICLTAASSFCNTTMISGTQVTRACRQERSFSAEPSKETTAARSFLKFGLLTRFDCNNEIKVPPDKDIKRVSNLTVLITEKFIWKKKRLLDPDTVL